MTKPKVEIRNLHKRFGDNEVLRGIDCDIMPGEVVCIIGDYLSTGIEQSTIKIAEHYGAKSVDLYAVNGFNDQTYMPKHDYNPSTGSGCHPSSKAMEYIANKIYTELGSWLEE